MDTKTSMDLLPNISNLPDWLQEAYQKDPTVHRTVKDWQLSGRPESVLWERLAIRLYEQKNFWEESFVTLSSRTLSFRTSTWEGV